MENSNPIWCPHKESCTRLVGGQDNEATMCIGTMQISQDHCGVLNTHRMCIRTFEGDIGDYQVCKSDLWYMQITIENARKKM